MQGHELMEQETSKFTNDILKIRDKFVTDGMIVICLIYPGQILCYNGFRPFYNKINYRFIMRADDHPLSKLWQRRVCFREKILIPTCYLNVYYYFANYFALFLNHILLHETSLPHLNLAFAMKKVHFFPQQITNTQTRGQVNLQRRTS